MPARVRAPAGLVALLLLGSLSLGSLGLAGCGGGPSLTNAQIRRWLTAVQGYSNQPRLTNVCFLLTRAQLTRDITHPDPPWSVEGFNDQTSDQGGFMGCSIRSGTVGRPGAPGDGELGLVGNTPPATSSAGNPSAGNSSAGGDAGTVTRTVSLSGTHYRVYYQAWPGTKQGSSAEMSRVVADVVHNLSAPPPASPSAAVYVGPSTGL